jgi:hypothetical protein
MIRKMRERRGAVLVLFALALISLLAACGLAIDSGHWYHTRAKLQSAADAAALAAVLKLPNTNAAMTACLLYLEMNGVAPGEIDGYGPVGTDRYEVKLKRNAGPFFTSIVGIKQIIIACRALAMASSNTNTVDGAYQGTGLAFALYGGVEFDKNGKPFELSQTGCGIKINGDVHHNGSLKFGGGDQVINGSITVSHEITGTAGGTGHPGGGLENQPTVPFPDISEATLLDRAKQAVPSTYLKFVGGVLKQWNGSELSTPVTLPSGYSFNSNTLSFDGATTFNGTFYLEGIDLHINNNGSNSQATFYTDGKIQLNANGGTYGMDAEFAFITTNTDPQAIKISGNDQTIKGALIALSGGIDIAGNGNTIDGAVVQNNAKGLSGCENTINHSPTQFSNIPVQVGVGTFVRLIE